MRSKRINNECMKWRERLRSRGFYCVFCGSDGRGVYESIEVYDYRFRAFRGEFATPRQAYGVLLNVNV